MIQFKTIRSRIFITLLTAIFFLSVTLFIYLFNDLKTRTFDTFDSVNQTINKMLVSNIRGYIYNKDHKNIKLVIDSIESEYINNILILDTDGHVIVEQKEINEDGARYSYFKALKNSSSHSVKSSKRYMILNTFELLDVPLGYLVVEGNMQYHKQEINKNYYELIIMIVSLFLVALFIAFYLSGSVSSPLYNIIKRLQRTQDNEILKFKHESEEEFTYLTKTIEEKHNSLLHLNAQLEDEVERKTHELKKLNETLEEKIDEAVKDVQTKEQILQQQTRLAQMGEMISMIAHQWRQPLAAITTSIMVIDRNIETGKFDLSNSDDRKAFWTFLEEKLDNINEHIQYLSTTTDDFRNFFNPYTNKERLSINIPLNKALQLIQTSMKNNGIKLTVDLESTAECKLYQNEVMQVILNLIKNAADALIENTITDKQISIRTYDNNDEVKIEICDNAGGIRPDIIENIFDPYFSTKDNKQGTGLGLYMSKIIMEEHHNGKIEVKRYQDGSCFILIFPKDYN